MEWTPSFSKHNFFLKTVSVFVSKWLKNFRIFLGQDFWDFFENFLKFFSKDFSKKKFFEIFFSKHFFFQFKKKIKKMWNIHFSVWVMLKLRRNSWGSINIWRSCRAAQRWPFLNYKTRNSAKTRIFQKTRPTPIDRAPNFA